MRLTLDPGAHAYCRQVGREDVPPSSSPYGLEMGSQLALQCGLSGSLARSHTSNTDLYHAPLKICRSFISSSYSLRFRVNIMIIQTDSVHIVGVN